MDGGGSADRAVTIVGDDRAVIGLGHHRDLAQLVHAAGIDRVGLDVVAGVFL